MAFWSHLINLPEVYSQRLKASDFSFILFSAIGYTIIYFIILQQRFLIFLFCLSFEINKHAIFTHLTYGQTLHELLQLKIYNG